MGLNSNLHAPVTTPPGQEPPVRIGYEVGWAPESASTVWRREKSLAPAGNRTHAVQLVARRCTDWAIPAPPQIIKHDHNIHDIIINHPLQMLIFEHKVKQQIKEFHLLGYNAA
jgi:hypothetical protein